MFLYRLFLVFLALAAAGACAQPADLGSPADYVGLRYPPDPPGVKDFGGHVINPGAAEEFSLAHKRDAWSEMLWLERLTHHDERGTPFVEVLAVLRLPRMREGELLLAATCRVGSIRDEGGDGRTIAIARVEAADVEVFDRVLHAWQVDLDARRFVVLDPAGVQCHAEAYGVD